MKFKGLASFVAVAVWVSAVANGCSSPTSGTTTNNRTTPATSSDAGKKTSGGSDGSGDPGSGNSGSNSGSDSGSTTADGTVGNACTTDTQCDVTGRKVNKCTSDAFPAGTLMPSPVCIGTSCDPGDGTTILACDNGKGACLAVRNGGICVQACTFASDGAAPQGCTGKNACNVLGYGANQQGALEGVGFCLGGCAADADCTGGDKCDLLTGLCLKTVTPPTKKVGDACTAQDTACNCLAGASNAGYCSQFCKVGGNTCTTGFVCSAELPKTSGDGGVLFTQQPTGIAGTCLKTCATDADCTALGAKCNLNDASGKVCVPQ
jgi:hypothetical protein